MFTGGLLLYIAAFIRIKISKYQNKPPLPAKNNYGCYSSIKITEGTSMSPKELLYIEDALGHEKQLSSCCKDLAEQLSDGELKSFVNELSGKHQASFNKFYGLLTK